MTLPVIRVVDAAASTGAAIDEAARRLRVGGLVAFPTETVYGLGANALDPGAVARIYAAKGRPATNPLICHVPDAPTARHQLAAVWPPAATALAEAFWPGPLTLVVPARSHVPAIVTAGSGTVAIRVPAHPVALSLLAAADRPIAAPSANRSTALSPTRAEHVLQSLGAGAEFILDGGPTDVGIESTVLDLTNGRPVLLRPGSISRSAIEAVVGPIDVAPPIDAGTGANRAPGRSALHYAPNTPLQIVSSANLAAAAAAAERPGIVRRANDLPAPQRAGTVSIELPDDPAGFARRLYAALHELDAVGCSTILLVRPPEAAAWDAVHDRLSRAVHG